MYGPYHTYAAFHHPGDFSRGHEQHQQVVEVLLNGIIGKATATDFYRRLADVAPHEDHRSQLLQIAEEERGQWFQLTNLYTSMMGVQPMYSIEPLTFSHYEEGLERGYEAEIESYEHYRLGTMLTGDPTIYEAFVDACKGEWHHADLLRNLGASAWNRTDYGPDPYTVNIDEATLQNEAFRTALWTGDHLQLTLMSIDVGDDIGFEIHPKLDQFLRIEQGQGIVEMGNDPNNLTYKRNVEADYAIIIPAGTWHNLTNTGSEPLKLYSIYAPPQHPKGTVHQTKADAMAAEEAGHGRTYW
ncbi:cupin domain-containing protein [Rossellomorea aquimaris]|uniref:cupin domain-containing protein n=1 Tax=Rossellomorea aquimaris TaxID=189382 RepID=UPI001CD233BA|nr:cupin domain-containing protein [Rossellomorea aquimaris]MCA1055827.1 cupin domain-containing protein [Rossellomorea aquimaris]